MVRRLLDQLGIKNVFFVDLGKNPKIDRCYERLFQARLESLRKGAKPRDTKSELQNIKKLKALGLGIGSTFVNKIKSNMQDVENTRTKRMKDAALERKRLKDLIKFIAKADPKDLSCQDMIKETNVEVRKMLFNKIGAVRVLKELKATVLDKQGSYELVDLVIGDEGQWRRTRPFLKMLNPSTGETHVEGVPPGTKTVNEALAWRNQLQTWQEPIKLT
jgi:hypothetical protein